MSMKVIIFICSSLWQIYCYLTNMKERVLILRMLSLTCDSKTTSENKQRVFHLTVYWKLVVRNSFKEAMEIFIRGACGQ